MLPMSRQAALQRSPRPPNGFPGRQPNTAIRERPSGAKKLDLNQSCAEALRRGLGRADDCDTIAKRQENPWQAGLWVRAAQ